MRREAKIEMELRPLYYLLIEGSGTRPAGTLEGDLQSAMRGHGVFELHTAVPMRAMDAKLVYHFAGINEPLSRAYFLVDEIEHLERRLHVVMLTSPSIRVFFQIRGIWLRKL